MSDVDKDRIPTSKDHPIVPMEQGQSANGIGDAKEPSLIRRAFHAFMTEELLPLKGHAYNEADRTKVCLFAFGAYYALTQVLEQSLKASDPQLQAMKDVINFFAPRSHDGFTSEYVAEFFTVHLSQLLRTKSNVKITRAGGQAAREFAQKTVYGPGTRQEVTHALSEIISKTR
jgi:hypothetical protein